MKKVVSTLAIVMFVVVMSVTALAHGHSSKKSSHSTKYVVCGIKSCDIIGVHAHNGKKYTAHYYGDGHKYHDYCNLSDCTLNGYHAHDGVYHFAHTANDGHGSWHSQYVHH